MMLTGLLVFLFGTAVFAGPYRPHETAEIIISKDSLSDGATEYYQASGGSPFISNFIQKGTNVFFKPQFMLSAAQMPPQVQTMIAAIEKDDCKTTLPMGPIPVLMEEPLRVVQKEIVSSTNPIVKEVIEINPVEYNQHVETIIELTPDMPSLDMHVLDLTKRPVVVKESVELVKPCPEELVVIPPAPELPVFEMPKLPVLIEMPQTSVEVVPETTIVEVPPAPILPPLEMPKLPVLVEEPCSPEDIVEVYVKPEEIPEVTVVPSFIPEGFIREVVISPPEAPKLNPYVPVDLPKPVMVEENLVLKPIEIPTAPLLPPFEMPKLSTIVEEASIMPCPPGEKINEIVIKPVEVPEAPVLPPYIPQLLELIVPEAPVLIPYIPKPIIIEESSNTVVDNEILEPLTIPVAPELPPFKMPELPLVIEEVSSLDPCAPIEVDSTPLLIPEAPVLQALPEPTVQFEIEKQDKPCDTVEIKESMVIPEAPVLTSYIPIETHASLFVEKPTTVEIQNSLVFPSGPILPPLDIPKAPVVVKESAIPCPPEKDLEKSKLVIESRPVIMPVPYVLPELSESNTDVSKPIYLTSVPEFLVPYFPVVSENLMKEEPATCVHDIVVERILPKLKKSFLPKAAKVPVSTYLAPQRFILNKVNN